MQEEDKIFTDEQIGVSLKKATKPGFFKSIFGFIKKHKLLVAIVAITIGIAAMLFFIIPII